MVFKDDVQFLIEEYTCRFGEPPYGVLGCDFPNRKDWTQLVRAIRHALDSSTPILEPVELPKAA